MSGYTFDGDVSIAATWYPFAVNYQRRLKILFKDLLTTPSRVVEPVDGVLITISAQHIHISVNVKANTFVYRTVTGIRKLKGTVAGFAHTDAVNDQAGYGNIDWEGRVSWNGTHRYSAVVAELNPDLLNPKDLLVYQDGKIIDLETLTVWDGTAFVNAGIVGVVAGACIFKGALVVYVYHRDPLTPFSATLKTYFIKKGTVVRVDESTITNFTRLLQGVLSSSDGSQAVTIATTEEAGFLQETVSATIQLSLVNGLFYSQATFTAYNEFFHSTGTGYPYQNAYPLKRFIVARDFDKKLLKEFFIESKLEYQLGRLIGTINYNDEYLVTVEDNPYATDLGLSYAHDYDFIIVATLDLRHKVFAYTRHIEHQDAGGAFNSLKKHYVQIGALRVKFKVDETVTGTFPNIPEIAAGQNTPLYPFVFRNLRELVAGTPKELFYVPYQWNLFNLQICQSSLLGGAIVNCDTNYDVIHPVSSSQHFEYAEVLNRVVLPLIDKSGNKMFAFSPVKGVLSNAYQSNVLGTISFTRDPLVIIKIDNKGFYYVNGAKQAAISDTVLSAENQILELKGIT